MNFLRHLPKRRYGNRGGGAKYYIDCSVYHQYPEHIQTETLLRNVDKQNVAILRAVANDDTIQKKNKHIVVKIIPSSGSSNPLATKEYEIGEILFQHKLPGFIRYICHFPCFDDTAKTAVKIAPSKPSRPYTKPICQASPLEENRKNVLVMPYIRNGSIETYPWNQDSLPLLTSLLMHTVVSLAMAFQRLGFTHGDLHLGNVLFKPTKQTQIPYFIGGSSFSLDTLGHKIVMMDFEKALCTHRESTIPYWRDVLFLCKRVETCFDYFEDYYITWSNRDLMDFLHNAIKNGHPLDAVQPLLDLVLRSEFVIRRLR